MTATKGTNMTKIINLDGVDYAPLRDAVAIPSDGDALATLVGQAVFVRTVTMHHVGTVDTVTADSIVLTDASWVTDSGRFSTALRTGELSEVEPFVGPVFVARGAIVDVTTWDHLLPMVAK